MSEELKPCPFCGGKAEFERVGTSRMSCIVGCEDCGAHLESGETWDSGHRWNARSDAAAKAQGAAEERRLIVVYVQERAERGYINGHATAAGILRGDHIKQETKPNE